MTIELPDALEKQMREKCAREGCSVNEGILAVFGAWLAGDSGGARAPGKRRIGCLARRLGKKFEVGERAGVKLSEEELCAAFEATKWADAP